ncbi:hypothetical protein [Streptomyces sp. NBC_00316]|uniref:hypothetical protein n=1 Tax=Streptomyces sp. NBC_00316 TaxID=2975710 RepID=UPI002E28DEEC|nr:hypothetical protein [Streptomyces sp. NBC_00316]
MGASGQGSLLRDERTAAPAAVPPFHAAAPLPAAVTGRARRLEVLLGDPCDQTNPYGHHALALPGGLRRLPALSGIVESEIRPAGKGGHFVGGDFLVAALRPLFRRDLALGHAAVTAALFADDGPDGPLPDRTVELARLVGPAALSAAAGTALRAAVRAVAEGERRAPGLSRWRASLARSFADLVACESLTAVALRSLSRSPGTGRALRAAAGCVVPALAAEILDEAVLTLGECGHEPDSAALRWCVKTAAEVSCVREATGTADCRAELVRGLPSSAGSGGGRVAAHLAAARRDADAGGAVPPVNWEAELHRVLDAAATRGDSGGAAGPVSGQARAAQRLLAERRLLTGPDRTVVRSEAVAAERYAQLITVCVVLAVRRDAVRYGGSRFLASGVWAALALARAVQRLGLPPVGPFDEAQAGVEAELDKRDRLGADSDLHATRILW